MEDVLDGVRDSRGPSKIMAPYQVSTDEEAHTCLRGVAAKIRGVWQWDPVFSPGNIIAGHSINTLSFETLCGLVHGLCSSMGVNLVDVLYQFVWQQGHTLGSENQFIECCSVFIKSQIVSDENPIVFADGLSVGPPHGSLIKGKRYMGPVRGTYRIFTRFRGLYDGFKEGS